jgi:hypothetical protein
MTTRTFFATGLLIIGLSAAAHAQNFHAVFHSMQQVNALLDSLEAPHLRVAIQQPDKKDMRFRISFSNPNSRHATIIIRKKDDIYFHENVAEQEYASMYDFNQLEDGDYQVVVVVGKEKVSTNITIHTETKVDRQAILH